MEYGQFCPVAKAMELLGEKWTMLILRELHMGASRFNELQRGLCQISPPVLTKRLNDLADAELILRKKIPGQRINEYFLTQAGMETLPMLKVIGEWGMRWARGDIRDSDLDVELLMLYLQRSIRGENLPGNGGCPKFRFCRRALSHGRLRAAAHRIRSHRFVLHASTRSLTSHRKPGAARGPVANRHGCG